MEPLRVKLAVLAALAAAGVAQAQVDPGVRPGAGATGDAISGLSPGELQFFLVGREDFDEDE